VTLGATSHVYDGGPKGVSVLTQPLSLSVAVTYDGQPNPPTAAGTYAVVAAVTDPNHQGAATAQLTIAKATATIRLDALVQTFDGTPRAVSAVTTPPNLNVRITYAGSSTPPAAIGSYPVSAVIDDPNHQGETTARLEITAGTATVTLANLNQTYDGSPRSVSVTTSPASLPVLVTYNGLSTPPTAAGSYAVTATVDHPDFSASASATLTIARAPQTISFRPPSRIGLGDDPLQLTATVTPPHLAPTFSVVQGPGRLVSPDLLEATGMGLIVVAANQPGDANHLPATEARANVTAVGASFDARTLSVAGGRVAFRLTVAPGTIIRIQSSTDLRTWRDEQRALVSGSTLDFNATLRTGALYYRALVE